MAVPELGQGTWATRQRCFGLTVAQCYCVRYMVDSNSDEQSSETTELTPEHIPELVPEQPLASIVIVGRPNVGKSTLFNAILGNRRSIVGDEPGITRDRIIGQATYNRKTFELIDTGGIIPNDEELIPKQILRQARVALEQASHIIFLIDGRTEITSADRDLAVMLKRLGKPVALAVNKIDTGKSDILVHEFHELGFEDVFAVSAEHRIGIGELLDCTTAKIVPADEVVPDKRKRIKVAIIGRPNVGKSTLINTLTGSERAIVSPIAGYAHEEGRAIIVVANKWDAVEDKSKKKFEEEIRDELKFLEYAQTAYISAKFNRGVKPLYKMIQTAYDSASLRVGTGELNRFAKDLTLEPDVRVKYITQAGIRPPTFVVFTDRRGELHFSAARNLTNRIRRAFGFKGTPIVIKTRPPKRREKK